MRGPCSRTVGNQNLSIRLATPAEYRRLSQCLEATLIQWCASALTWRDRRPSSIVARLSSNVFSPAKMEPGLEPVSNPTGGRGGDEEQGPSPTGNNSSAAGMGSAAERTRGGTAGREGLSLALFFLSRTYYPNICGIWGGGPAPTRTHTTHPQKKTRGQGQKARPVGGHTTRHNPSFLAGRDLQAKQAKTSLLSAATGPLARPFPLWPF